MTRLLHTPLYSKSLNAKHSKRKNRDEMKGFIDDSNAHQASSLTTKPNKWLSHFDKHSAGKVRGGGYHLPAIYTTYGLKFCILFIQILRRHVI